MKSATKILPSSAAMLELPALRRSVASTLPAPAGLDVAASYLPVDGEIGGDWYDVFALPGGRVGIVVGDAMGHGPTAARLMHRLRSTLRAVAADHENPATVLSMVDRALHNGEVRHLATVAYGVLGPSYDRMLLSSAGHHAPFVVAPGRPAQQVALASYDPMLGVDPRIDRTTTVVDLPPHASLCLFTDGLVERRPTAEQTDVDVLAEGIDALGAALRPGDATSACATAVDTVLAGAPLEDDVALLIARCV